MNRRAEEVTEQTMGDLEEEPFWQRERDWNGREARVAIAEGGMGRWAGLEV